MKIISILLFAAVSLQAQSFHFEIPARTIAHPVVAFKSAAASPNKLHRATFYMGIVGAFCSVGLDMGTTEFVNKHSYRWYPGQGYVQTAHEDNTFFTTNGQISQPKLIISKLSLAAVPFAASWLIHDIDPNDSNLIDTIDLTVTGALSGWYAYAAKGNYDIAEANIKWNRMYGK